MADFVYGNTRLRARKADLLTRRDYEGLLGRTLEELLGALDATVYGPDLEAALTRFPGLRGLQAAVSSHLARSLEDMRSFYQGRARRLVDLLLSNWNLRNLLALLRGLARAAEPEEILATVVPVGGLDAASARELARQPEMAAAVQLLAAWRLPTPEDAHSLLEAWPEYERSENLAALENSLARAHAARTEAALEEEGGEAAQLRWTLAARVDVQNLLVALRLREALAEDELPGSLDAEDMGWFLPGGAMPEHALVAVLRGVTPDDAARALADESAASAWQQPLERFARDGEVTALQADLEAALAAAAVALFTRGDPLGIAIPIAFAAAKDVEARNLRLLGEGAARGADSVVVESRLLLLEP